MYNVIRKCMINFDAGIRSIHGQLRHVGHPSTTLSTFIDISLYDCLEFWAIKIISAFIFDRNTVAIDSQ